MNTLRINFLGGIVAPKFLKNILEIACRLHITKVSFGLRQQLLLSVPEALTAQIIKALDLINVSYQIESNHYPNLISSYVGEEVFQSGNWLTEGIYQDLFDGFRSQPRLKINISDAQQSFTPFFSGHLNFVSSGLANYWYLYLRLPKTNEAIAYHSLVYSTQIPMLCNQLEAQILAGILDVFALFDGLPRAMSRPVHLPLQLPKFNLPYYEGLNRYGDQTWLGVYRRDQFFDTQFLIELCQLCLDTKIGLICLTPWKSLIIKGINNKSRNNWTTLLAKYSINVRHAANELNWQIEDDSPRALALKYQLVRAFDQDDLRTFGICFGIKTIPKTEVFASIMIRQRPWKLFNFLPIFKVYDISYTQDFDPNGRAKIYFAQGISYLNLAEQLRRSVLFYNKKIAENSIEKPAIHIPKKIKQPSNIRQEAYHCQHCQTIYDPVFGDELNGIEPGILFDTLPQSFSCATCQAPKADFLLLNSTQA